MMRKLGRGGRVAAWSAAGVLAAATVAGAVASGMGVAAATSTGSAAGVRETSAAPTPGQWTMPGPGGQVRVGMTGPMGMLAGPAGRFAGPAGRTGTPLYGTWTFRQGGTEHTYRMQTGTLSATGGSSFTVTSSDHTAYSYTADASTRLMKNGNSSTLAALSGATVRVVAEETGGRYVARAVLSGMPPRMAVEAVEGVLHVAADGRSVTVNGQKFVVDSSTRAIGNGKPTTLSKLNGTKARVVGVKNSAGSLVARLVLSGSGPRPGGPHPGHFRLWPGSNGPASAPSASA